MALRIGFPAKRRACDTLAPGSARRLHRRLRHAELLHQGFLQGAVIGARGVLHGVEDVLGAALRRLVGTYRAERMMVAGQMLEPEQALAIGLVDELTGAEEVLPRALAWLNDLLNLPPQAMSTTRLLARSDLIELFADPTRLSVEEFADGWFGAETQTTLNALVAKLKKA